MRQDRLQKNSELILFGTAGLLKNPCHPVSDPVFLSIGAIILSSFFPSVRESIKK